MERNIQQRDSNKFKVREEQDWTNRGCVCYISAQGVLPDQSCTKYQERASHGVRGDDGVRKNVYSMMQVEADRRLQRQARGKRGKDRRRKNEQDKRKKDPEDLLECQSVHAGCPICMAKTGKHTRQQVPLITTNRISLVLSRGDVLLQPVQGAVLIAESTGGGVARLTKAAEI